MDNKLMGQPLSFGLFPFEMCPCQRGHTQTHKCTATKTKCHIRPDINAALAIENPNVAVETQTLCNYCLATSAIKRDPKPSSPWAPGNGFYDNNYCHAATPGNT